MSLHKGKKERQQNTKFSDSELKIGMWVNTMAPFCSLSICLGLKKMRNTCIRALAKLSLKGNEEGQQGILFS